MLFFLIIIDTVVQAIYLHLFYMLHLFILSLIHLFFIYRISFISQFFLLC